MIKSLHIHLVIKRYLMLKRLFVKLPLYTLFFISVIIFVIPIGYWIITGNDYTELMDEIDYL